VVRPRTWDVSLDGWDHVVTYTPRRSDVEMSLFAVDGRPIPIAWHPEKETSGKRHSRADFELGNHRGAFHWRFSQRPSRGRLLWLFVQLLGALGGAGSTDPDDDQVLTVDVDLWLTVDGRQVAARGESTPTPATPTPSVPETSDEVHPEQAKSVASVRLRRFGPLGVGIIGAIAAGWLAVATSAATSAGIGPAEVAAAIAAGWLAVAPGYLAIVASGAIGGLLVPTRRSYLGVLGGVALVLLAATSWFELTITSNPEDAGYFVITIAIAAVLVGVGWLAGRFVALVIGRR
jgi:hypothetical protein